MKKIPIVRVLLLFIWLSVIHTPIVLAQKMKRGNCYLKVELVLGGSEILTHSIQCYTFETKILDEQLTQLSFRDWVTDSTIHFSRYFNLGRRRKVKKIEVFNIELKLLDARNQPLQSIRGEINQNDLYCR